jgi:hypothetical protein
MDAKALRCLLAAATLAAAAPLVRAEPGVESCEIPRPDLEPLANRAALLAEYERLPHACLQAIFTDCSTAASHTMLDFGSAAVCSLGYEAWLKQRFGGNFRALLAWWRAQRSDAPQ